MSAYPAACWGDSLTAAPGFTSYPSLFELATGIPTYNGGVSGESSTEVKDRMLAFPEKFIDSVVIWVGNNFTNQATIVADVATMVAALGHNRYVVMAMLNAAQPDQYEGTPGYDVRINTNLALQAVYGPRFWDVRAFLVANYNPGNPTDVFDHSVDCPPASLRSDNIHLNQAGYDLVAQELVASFLYFLEPPPLPTMALKPVLPGGLVQVPASGIVGTVGATDNGIPRADGTGGSTLQASLVTIDDNGTVIAPGGNGVPIIESPASQGSGQLRLFSQFIGGTFWAGKIDLGSGGFILFANGRLQTTALPTSSAGLSSGEFYTTAGAVFQVP